MSRFITSLLRHGAIKAGLSIDNDGYVLVDDLLDLLKVGGSPITTLDQIKDIVATDDKQRMHLLFKNNKFFLKANQGHSMAHISNDQLIPITDVSVFPIVVHGTFESNLDSIMKFGLSRMKRNHIHFAQGTDSKSGIRTNSTIFIILNMEAAIKDGIKFFLSNNGVILSPGNNEGFIDPKYFLNVIDITNKELLKSCSN